MELFWQADAPLSFKKIMNCCSDKYSTQITREKHIQNWTRELVHDVFDNSVCKFFALFTGGKKITEEEREELKKLLNN